MAIVASLEAVMRVLLSGRQTEEDSHPFPHLSFSLTHTLSHTLTCFVHIRTSSTYSATSECGNCHCVLYREVVLSSEVII